MYKRSNSIAVNNLSSLKPNSEHDLKHKRSFSSGANINSPLYAIKHEHTNNSHLRVHSETANATANNSEGADGESVIRRSRSASISYPKNKNSKGGDNATLSKMTMQEITKTWTSTTSVNSSLSKDDPTKLLPSFVYLQLHSLAGGNKKGEADSVYLLPDDDATTRGLSVLDRTPVVDLHKIGIVYVGRGQFDEQSILSNQSGSYHYQVFLQNIGKLVKLSNLQGEYTGGLDTRRGVDGEFAVMSEDEITKIVFHVATLMPTVEHDPKCMAKKRHIGNDYILIVYNESGKEYEFRTIPGQFNFINIIITPVDNDYLSMSHHQNILYRSNSNLHEGITSSTKLNPLNPLNSTSLEENEPYFIVSMQRREDMPEIGPLAIPKIVSLSVLPIFVRQLATHFNIYAQTFRQNLNGSTEYISNWGERLRQIKRVKTRVNKINNPGLNLANPAMSSANNSQSSLHSQYKYLHNKNGAKTPLNISHHINSALTPNSTNNSPALSHKRGNPQHSISTNSIISSSSNDSVNSLNNGGTNYNSGSIYNRAKSPERMNPRNLNNSNVNTSKDTNLEALLDFTKYT